MSTSNRLQTATANEQTAIAFYHQPVAVSPQRESSRQKPQRGFNVQQWLKMASQTELWSLLLIMVIAVVSRQAVMFALPISVGFGWNWVTRQRTERQMQQRFNTAMSEVAQIQTRLQNQSNRSWASEVSELEQRLSTLEKADWQQPLSVLQQWVSDIDVSAEALHDRTRILDKLQQQVENLRQRIECQTQKRVAIFIDGNAFYHTVEKLSIKINYAQLLAWLIGDESLFRAYFYMGVDAGNEKQQEFVAYLREIGYRVVTKEVVYRRDGSFKCDFGVDIAADLLNLVGCYERAVLVSDNNELAVALKAVSEKGARVEVVSWRSRNSNDELFNVADGYVELETIQDEVGCASF